MLWKKIMESIWLGFSEMIPIFEETGNKLTNRWLKQLSEKGTDGKVVVDAQNELTRTVIITIHRVS